MASNTKNLNLLMKNPSTDGADTFNVQTMLNENWQKIDNNAGTVAQTLANILKPTTPPIIGLPPSTTPDGMFQALGNTGELHVWRKTTVTTEPVPAGYKLGDVLTHGSSYIACQINGSSYVNFVIQEATSITVNDNGIIEASWGSNISVAYGDSYTFTPNRFVKIVSINANAINSNFAAGDVVWVPSDGKIHGTYVQQNDGAYLYYLEFTKCQKVNAHGIIPAGTTTTYPVSTNPNAYQEGDDAKAAGYVLEASKQMIAFKTTNSSYKYYAYNYAESISVSDDGTVSLVGALKASGKPFQTDSFNAAKGKFCQFVIEDWFDGYVSTEITGIVFIPSDAVFSVTTLQATCSKVQSVTGYAAIPAGTTIEYLGKLGDKARVQVLSYVGTGTYGSSNPNSVTASFPIKLLAVLTKALKNSNGNFTSRIDFNNQYREDPFMVGAALTTEYTLGSGCGYKVDSYDTSYGKKSNDGKTFSWYTTGSNAARQFNESGYTYTVLLIG